MPPNCIDLMLLYAHYVGHGHSSWTCVPRVDGMFRREIEPRPLVDSAQTGQASSWRGRDDRQSLRCREVSGRTARARPVSTPAVCRRFTPGGALGVVATGANFVLGPVHRSLRRATC